MTEIQKLKADDYMMRSWQKFIYEKVIAGDNCDYRHLDGIIRSGMFLKKYVQCEKNIKSYWIFLFCAGEFGFFDGVVYRNYFPVSLAELLEIDDEMKANKHQEFEIVDGCYKLTGRRIS